MAERDQPVTLDYAQLLDPAAELGAAVEAAYGPDGLGLLLVNGVPGYAEARGRLLPLASRLASLPAAALEALEDPASTFNFGWSHGKETMNGGQPDTAKGSFYANPLLDVPTEGAELAARYPHYCRPNVWPRDSLPELEPALKACGRLMVDCGLLLAARCDAYVAARAPSSAARLRRSIAESRCLKARLLHYFPLPGGGEAPSDDVSSWCGWHLDHGSLTALASAQYSDGRGEVACPDASAGLYIRARDGRVVHVRIPPHSLAFQMGESSQIHSGGLLMATPHCVRAACGPAAAGVSRDTFAVFLQPHYEAPMDCPPGSEARVGVPQWSAGQDFGAFSAAKVADYYGTEL